MDELICCRCRDVVLGIEQLKNHYRRIHAIDVSENQNAGFKCFNGVCNNHFLRYTSLIRHIKTHHITVELNDNYHVDENVEIGLDNFLNPEVYEPADNILADNLFNLGIQENEPADNRLADNNLNLGVEENEPIDIVASASKLIAKLQLNCSFTRANIDRVIDLSDKFCTDIITFVKHELTKFFNNTNTPLDTDEAKELFNTLNVQKPFKVISGIDKQLQNLKNNFKYINPIEIPLGKRDENRFNKKTQSYELKEIIESFQYVSIIETLKLIMSHNDIRDHVNSEKSLSNGYLSNFRDGESFKSNLFFKKYPTALRIQFYYDDVVVNNSLGTKVHPHKLAMFYFTVQNLPPHINNFFGGVHVAMIAYLADVAKYGMESIMKPFMHDLGRLESDEGVTFDVDNEIVTLRASLACVCADSLAVHQLFGLLSPSARHFCRSCMIKRQDLLSGSLDNFQPRSRELYQEHVQRVMQNPQAMTETGLRENSCLHASKYFHCTDNFVFDSMHDILEGIAQLDLKLVIARLTLSEDYDLDVDTFNKRIHLFKYGINEIKNKPSPIFSVTSLRNLKDHTIPQKAVQTWCLLRIFPFLVSDKVADDDEYLKLILLLNRINEIVFAPKLHTSILPYLDELIKEHNKLFHKLFGHEVNDINKVHHLTHYPQCIQKSGPLRPLSCLLYEAKHSFYKRQGSVCCNYKNIAKTLINMSQICQTAVWGMDDEVRPKFQCSKTKTVTVENTLSKDHLIAKGLNNATLLLKTKKVEVYNMDYREDSIVAIDSGIATDEGMPIFGKVKEIIIYNNDIFLLCAECPALWLEESLNAYCFAESSQLRLVNTNDLPDSKPFSIWQDYQSEYLYISLRHFLM